MLLGLFKFIMNIVENEGKNLFRYSHCMHLCVVIAIQ
jgi:hypothetical protein